MKQLRNWFVLSVLVLSAASATHAQQSQPPAPTVASVVDGALSAVEKEVVEVAEAMPENKFNFTPETLNVPSGDFKGVRTFAVQVKHVAASNYYIWSLVIGEKPPQSLVNDFNGPADLETKAEILKFLKDSFALGHKAVATLTDQNMLQTTGNSKSSRLRLVIFGVMAPRDHYGQMVEYLRMNGIVPPASRPKPQ